MRLRRCSNRALAAALVMVGACSSGGTHIATGAGGTQATGGTAATGGTTGTGGAIGTGGTASTGGVTGTGGTTGIGGQPGTGGTTASGGRVGTDGSLGTGGSVASGGGAGTGGASGNGGRIGSGGSNALGGATGGGDSGATGGTTGTGGTTITGGTPATCDPTLPSSGTYYVAAADGSGSTCSASAPCSAGTAIGKLQAGQTAYLRAGTYSGLNVSKSGTAGNNIVIAAYPCELPFIDSGGVTITGGYISIRGLVARNAVTGFGNSYGAATGHLEYINCIADMHSMNGFAFRFATGLHIKQSIVAHTGYSTTNSWSSGVDLLGATGTYQDNIIEETVAFENVDMQKHTDGSGFIVDDNTTGATFVNNIGFRNGGSCIRTTSSTGTHIINNSCYGNGLDPQATAPTTPDEIFFSSPDATSVLYNNLAVATGKSGDTQATINTSSATNGNNVTNNKGTIDFWVDAAGPNPDFHLKSSATTIIGKGTTTEAPAEDIGFDPKCITNTAPTGSDVQSWWLYSVDYDYIKSIGGIAQCFHPKARSSPPDVGAYAY